MTRWSRRGLSNGPGGSCRAAECAAAGPRIGVWTAPGRPVRVPSSEESGAPSAGAGAVVGSRRRTGRVVSSPRKGAILCRAGYWAMGKRHCAAYFMKNGSYAESASDHPPPLTAALPNASASVVMSSSSDAM